MAASLGDTVLEVGLVEVGGRKHFARQGSRLRTACAHDDTFKREKSGSLQKLLIYSVKGLKLC